MNLIVIAAGILLLLLAFSPRPIERFYNVVPTQIIDPDFQYPVASQPNAFNNDWPALPPKGRPLFQRVGDNHGVDLSCHNVDLYDIARWIADENPRLIYEAVLRYDPSIDPLNPNHTPRVLRLLLQNGPYCSEGEKYLPVIRKCYPTGVIV